MSGSSAAVARHVPRALKRVARRVWMLDRSAPWDVAWGLTAVGWLIRGANWLTGEPPMHIVAVVLGSAIGACLVLWLVLYIRDAVHRRTTRRIPGALDR